MSTSVKLLIAVMVLAVQLAVPLTMIRGREAVLRKGEAFNFLTRPIDPIDPFQGRYVRLGLARDFIPGEESEANDLDYRNPLYATIAADEDGFAEFTSWSLDEPETGHYLKTRYAGPMLEWRDERETRIYKGIRVRIPFDRFYMDEAKAPRAELRVRAAAGRTNCWVTVRVYEGQAVIEDVFAEGQSLRDFAREDAAR